MSEQIIPTEAMELSAEELDTVAGGSVETYFEQHADFDKETIFGLNTVENGEHGSKVTNVDFVQDINSTVDVYQYREA